MERFLPSNEIRFDEPLTYVDPGARTPADLLPPGMKIAADGSVSSASDIYDAAGLSRHHSAGSCAWKIVHNAYECVGGLHRQLIIEDLEPDSMERRIAPVALLVDGYVSLATGPQNYAMGYTQVTTRLNTFWLTGVLGRTHQVHFTSTVPKKLRLHLRDVTDNQALVVQVHYGGVPNRVDAYVAGRRVAAAVSTIDVNTTSILPHGTSFHDVDSSAVTILLRGPRPVDLIMAPAVTLGVGLSVSTAEFFTTGYDGFVANVAMLLGVPQSRIRIPGASSGTGGRRRLQEADNTTDILVVIDGSAPDTIGDTQVTTVESTYELDLVLQQSTEEMRAVQNNLMTQLTLVCSQTLSTKLRVRSSLLSMYPSLPNLCLDGLVLLPTMARATAVIVGMGGTTLTVRSARPRCMAARRCRIFQRCLQRLKARAAVQTRTAKKRRCWTISSSTGRRRTPSLSTYPPLLQHARARHRM